MGAVSASASAPALPSLGPSLDPRVAPSSIRALGPPRWVLFTVALALVASTLIASIVGVHGGDATGPFLVGPARIGHPSVWPLPVRLAPSAQGYDGQYFLALALDPLLRAPLASVIDDPTYRSRRILWSAAAWVLSAGQARAAPIVLVLLLAAAIAWGGALVGAWAQRQGRSGWWGLAFVLNIGTLVCCWRMLGDAILVALLLTAILAAKGIVSRSREAPSLFLALALLQKETALLGVPALLPADARPRLPRLTPPRALALLAVVGWWSYLAWRRRDGGAFSLAIVFDLPYKGWVSAVATSLALDAGPLAMAKNLLLLGLFLAILVLGFSIGVTELRRARGAARFAGLGPSILLYSILGLFLSERVWVEVWAYSRALLPLASLQLLYGLEAGAEDAGSVERPLARALALAGAAAGVAFVAKNLLLRTP